MQIVAIKRMTTSEGYVYVISLKSGMNTTVLDYDGSLEILYNVFENLLEDGINQKLNAEAPDFLNY